MGLGHLFGLDAGERYTCGDCGRVVAPETDADDPTCPECGSTDLERLLLL
jgi:predicted RNA-binding Zn-ribbon protein involved in translation (DUF1610 family)